MKKLLKITGWLLLTLVAGIAGILIYVKVALPNVGPASELKVEITPERVEHGRYLANAVCACMDCHSTRDWTLFAGPLKDGTMGKGGERFDQTMGFPGVFYSKNITPAGLQDWTDGEIFRAITTGVSKDGRAMFPVMPYLSYGRMQKEDIYDIIAYLRSLEPVKNDIPASEPDFPMNFIVNTIPQAASNDMKSSATDPLKHGEYLVNAGGCRECHTPQDKGKPIAGKELAGGFEFKFPDNSVVRSANLTSDKESGIGNWSSDMFLARFKQYSDSAYVTPHVEKGSFQTVMPWMMYSQMSDDDILAIYAYLQTVKPVVNSVEKFTPAK